MQRNLNVYLFSLAVILGATACDDEARPQVDFGEGEGEGEGELPPFPGDGEGEGESSEGEGEGEGEGDPSIPRTCVEDSECLEHEECDSGLCQPDGTCGVDDHCPVGQICNPDNGKCEEQCQEDADCGEWERCLDGKCQARRCQRDDECDDDQFCELGAGVCAPSECREDTDCEQGEVCRLPEHRCAPDADCADDGLEENDSTRDAREIAIPADLGDLVACPADQDWYSVQVQAGDELKVQLEYDAGGGNLDAVIHSSAGPELQRSEGDGGIEIIDFIAPASDTYRVLVDPVDVDSALPYRLGLQLVGGPVVCEEEDGFEENDSADDAPELAPGRYEDLQMCANDPDWFAFRAEAGDEVTVTVEFENEVGDLDMAVYGPNADQPLDVSDGVGDIEAITVIAAESGLHYVEVIGFDGAQAPYTLQIVVEQGQECGEEDGFEDNDDIDSAVAVRPGDFEDLFVCAGDSDFYAIDVCANGTVSVSIEFTHEDGDLDLVLNGPDGQAVASSLSADDNEELEHVAEVAGRYTVRVQGFRGAQSGYSMSIAVGGCDDGPGDDGFEENDDLDSAARLPLGEQDGLISLAGDDDWYAVAVCANGTLSAAATFGEEGAVGIQIVDSDGAVLADDDGLDGVAEVEALAAQAGDLFVRVRATRGEVVGYTLSVDVAGCDDLPRDDAFEENDTQDTAADLVPGVHEDLRITPADDDFYNVDLCAGAVLTASIEFVHADGDLDMQLLDADGAVLASSTGVGDSEEVTVAAEQAGAYTIRVYGFRESEGPYTLTVDVDEAGCEGEVRDDGFEDNDVIGDASPLEPGDQEGLVVAPGDDDFYAVDVCAGGELTASIRFPHADGDIDLQILDAEGLVLASSLSVNDDESATAAVEAAGTYFVRVYGFRGEGNNYDLTIAVDEAGCEGEIRDDGFEDNDVIDDASPLQPGDHADLVIVPGDDDFYSFAVCAGGVVTATIDFSHADGDLNLDLLDADGNLLDTSNDEDDDEEVSAELGQAGNYILRVHGRDGAGGGYALSLAIDEAGCEQEGRDDGFEDNDVLADATPMQAGDTEDLVVLPGDDDFYAVDLCAGAVLDASIAFAHADGDLDLTLLDAEEAILARSVSVNDDEAVSYEALEAGTYYLRVYGFRDSGNDYSLSIAIDEAGCEQGGEDDGFEDNDTLDTAAPIEAGDHERLVIIPGDDDFYTIDVCAGAVLTATTRFSHADGDLDLALLDADGNVLAASTSVTDDEEVSEVIEAAGAVVIRVYGWNDAGGDYSLEIAVDEAGCEQGVRDDGFEDNDTLETAAAIGPGDFDDLVILPNDDDYYAVDVCAGGVLTADIRFLHADGDIDLAILNADGDVLVSSTSITDAEQVEQALEAAGTYTVRVYGFNGAGNGYSLSVGVDEAGCVAEDDQFEDNDTIDTAAAIGPGDYERLVVVPGDDDFFAVELCEGAELTASIAFLQEGGDLDFALLGPAGAQVAVSAGVQDAEEITYTALEDGTFTLRVHGFRGIGNEDYSLSVAVDEAECIVLPEDDELEDNDDVDTATDIEPGDLAGLVVVPGDEDWFAFELCEGAEATIELTFAHADGDLDMRLQGPDGNLIASAVSANDNETITHVAEAAGRYSLVVYGFANAGNGYDLSLAVDEAGCEPEIQDDRFEDNDDRDTATLLGPGDEDGLVIVPADDDWFAVDLCEGAELTASILFAHADGDIDMSLQEAGGAILASSTSITDDEQVTYLAQADGTVYLRVYGWDGAGNDYALSLAIDEAGCDQGPADDEFEDNDSQDTATPLDPGVYNDLWILSGDDDFYAVDLCAGAVLDARIDFLNADGDLDMALVDANLVQLDSSNGIGDSEAVTHVAGEDQTVHVHVFGFLQAENGYALTIEVDESACGDVDPPEPEDDGFEDNDALEDAAAIEAGDHADLAVFPNDLDYYSVDLCEGAELTVDLAFSHELGDVNLRIQDGEGNTLESSLGLDDSEQAVFVAEAAGTYYIRVDVLGDRGNAYDMGVAIDESGCDDEFEDNDDIDGAFPIDPGFYEDLYILSEDNDFYSVALCDGAELTATITFVHDDGDLDLRLLTEDGVEIDESNGLGDSEEIVHTAVGDQLVNLQVFGFGGESNSYDLLIEVDEAGCDVGPPPGEDDDLEENDDLDGSLELDPGVYDALVITANDEDWYAVALCEGAELDVTIDFVDADGDLDLELTDADGGQLSLSDGFGDQEAVNRVAPADETVHIRVYGFQGTENGYTMTIAVDEANCGQGPADDEFEENDDQLGAAPVGPGNYEGLLLGLDDEDWFSVELCEGAQLTATINFDGGEADLDLELQDVNGQTVDSSEGLGDSEQVDGFANEVTTAYLLIYSWNGLSTGYDLLIEVDESDCP